MKKQVNQIFLFLVLSTISAFQVVAQTETTKSQLQKTQISGSILSFDNTVCDFGVIPYNSPGKHIFVVTNTGSEPLIIYNCIKGCGCTQVEWTKTPIKPGEKGFVTAVYNTKKIGHFSRGVDVYSNDPGNPKVNIKLKGEVLVVAGGEAPPIVTETQVKPAASKTEGSTRW